MLCVKGAEKIAQSQQHCNNGSSADLKRGAERQVILTIRLRQLKKWNLRSKPLSFTASP